MIKHKMKSANGQALVEFALMLTVLLMLIFLIIEGSRILWGLVTVQNAAREGARYAITGRHMGPECAVQDLPKFTYLCAEADMAMLRTASIISATHRGLTGLPLDEMSGTMEDDNYYQIWIWGADMENNPRPNFGGAPGKPVVVRAMYRVPIITPFFNAIVPSVPVVGQVTEYNENFGQLGMPSTGQGVPPEVPVWPTVGPTPTYTPEPDPNACGTQFVNDLIAGPQPTGSNVRVTGELGVDATLINLSDPGWTPVTRVMQAASGYACEGYVDFSDLFIDTPLVAGHVYRISSPNPNNTWDERTVYNDGEVPPPPPPPPPPPICETRFAGPLVAGPEFSNVYVTGEPGELATLIGPNGLNVTRELLPLDGWPCPGFRNFSDLFVETPLVAGDYYFVFSPNETWDEAVVLGGLPTATPTTTPLPPPLPTLTPTATLEPTATPTTPFITILPTCGPGPNVTFSVSGANWPSNRNIALYWNNQLFQTIRHQDHDGSFTRQISVSNVGAGIHELRAVAEHGQQVFQHAVFYRVPCPGATPLPTTTATVTSTPAPADLIVVGPPELVSTPPIVAYQPVQYRVVISNTGEIDVNQQFFIDLYLDPGQVLTTHIPLVYSSGYQGVSGLLGQTSRALTITAPFGFHNEPENHVIYGMVDSLRQIVEVNEENNVSTPAFYDQVTPAATPTATSTPEIGDNSVRGLVLARINNTLNPQARAQVRLLDAITGEVVLTTITDTLGRYAFLDVPDGTYTINACISIDDTEYFGSYPAVQVPPAVIAYFVIEPGPCL
jgi:hypothetical protein